MRLSEEQVEIIITALRESFSDSEWIYLFGSRVDDSAKGGDIDLLVVSDESSLFNKKLKAVSRMVQRMGEQRIDLIAVDKKRFEGNEPVIVEAKKGICLWQKSA